MFKETGNLVHTINGKHYVRIDLLISQYNESEMDSLVIKFECIDQGVEVPNREDYLIRKLLVPESQIEMFQAVLRNTGSVRQAVSQKERLLISGIVLLTLIAVWCLLPS